MTSESPVSMPCFDDLPLDKSGPPGNAWGLWGSNDQLGRLNLLTPDVVAAAAASEIREGIRISLDWPLNKPVAINNFRQKFEHEILQQPPMALNDDAVSFNTQCTTQWDGFRHYGRSIRCAQSPVVTATKDDRFSEVEAVLSGSHAGGVPCGRVWAAWD